MMKEPEYERAYVAEVGKLPYRSTLNTFGSADCGNTAAQACGTRPSAVAGNKRALGGCQRQIIIPLCYRAIGQQRTDKTYRHLGAANEVFDIAFEMIGLRH